MNHTVTPNEIITHDEEIDENSDEGGVVPSPLVLDLCEQTYTHTHSRAHTSYISSCGCVCEQRNEINENYDSVSALRFLINVLLYLQSHAHT